MPKQEFDFKVGELVYVINDFQVRGPYLVLEVQNRKPGHPGGPASMTLTTPDDRSVDTMKVTAPGDVFKDPEKARLEACRRIREEIENHKFKISRLEGIHEALKAKPKYAVGQVVWTYVYEGCGLGPLVCGPFRVREPVLYDHSVMYYLDGLSAPGGAQDEHRLFPSRDDAVASLKRQMAQRRKELLQTLAILDEKEKEL